MNALSVIQFAVDGLKVQHIIVVGHSNCGGVKAALNDLRLGLVDNWIRHVKDVRFLHRELLERIAPELRVNALVELNVLEQSLNVCHTSAVQDAWARGQEVVVHGWVYGLHNGLLQDLRMTVRQGSDIQPAYAAALAALTARYVSEPSANAEPVADPAAQKAD
jgi:carbonic anhydrase